MDGYAGMAVDYGGSVVFTEGIEPAFAARLFEAARAGFPANTVSLVIRGFTISVFAVGSIRVACQIRGRFPPLPVLPDEALEYSTGDVRSGLLARADARKEAESMLKLLMKKG